MSNRERLGSDDIDRLGGLVGDLKSVSCGDHGCVFGHPGGLGTNGGCKCLDGMPVERRRMIVRVVRAIRMDLAQLLAELRRSREDGR